MQFQRHEVRTGLLVLLTLGILTGVVLYLSAPGLFKPLVTYGVFLDTATGLKQGGPVQLAGRNIGRVAAIISPVPFEKRPKDHPELEVLVEVTVDRSAKIYKRNTVRMQQIGMLGDFVVDFSQGDETSGLAPPNWTFVGERQIDFTEAVPRMIKMLEPVVKEATQTLQQFQVTANNLRDLTGKEGELTQALSSFNDLGQNLVKITAEDSPLNDSLKHLNQSLTDVNQITNNLVENRSIELTLQNFRRSSEQLNATLLSTQRTINGVSKGLDQTVFNMQQFSDTLKHQPWRLIWPTTKKYPEDAHHRR